MVAKTEPEQSTDTVGAGLGAEIVVEHDPNAGEVVEVRNLLLQSSLAEVKAHGYYDRYVECIAPSALDDLLSRVAPGWAPVTLALAHYEACDAMNLSSDELSAIGRSVGERLQETTLVTSAKTTRDENFDPWQIEAQMHRMWQRLYRGGSIQVTKLGPKEKLVEQRGFPMNRYQHFRHGSVQALVAAHTAVGLQIGRIRVDRYDAKTHEVAIRLSWL